MVHKRICPVCEAGCGLIVSADGRTVTGIEANKNDLFSTGHICAKGLSLAELDADPDRLQTPMIRRNGELVAATYDEAFDLIQRKLTEIRSAHGPNATASYLGNPTAHNVGLIRGAFAFLGALGSTNVFSAATVDQWPKQFASALMFGNGNAIPIPDIERADFLLMLGANPIVSNGSLWMVPGFRDKLRAFKERGGTFVTVDPRLSETARLADKHLGIAPGTDAYLLAALINEMVAQGASLSADYGVSGWDALRNKIGSITTADAAAHTGIAESDIQTLAADLLAAQSPAVYGRVGTTLQRYGTLSSFLIEAINLLAGSLDRVGGAMFSEQPFASRGPEGMPLEYGRYSSRVSGAPEVLGQMPVSVLAEEIETSGEGQIKSLVCFAGNPVVSNPDSERLSAALEQLDFLVCIDIYHNETTKLADVILPGTSPFEKGHYDDYLSFMAYRNVARYSPPIFDGPEHSEWDFGVSLAYVLQNSAVPNKSDLANFEDDLLAAEVARYTSDPEGALYGRDVQEILGMIGPESGVERVLDLGIRAGRYGDHFGKQEGLTLQQMIDEQDGIDLGAPRPGRLKELLNTPDGQIDMAPDIILEELDRLTSQVPEQSLQLIGRRGTRTNNSWLGNLPMLGKGSAQCVLEIHPEAAAERNLSDGDLARLTTDVSSVEVEVVLTDRVVKSVVSLPHGFSEGADILQHKRQLGANYNQLIPVHAIDKPSGTSALNGYPVSVSRVQAEVGS